MYAWDMAMSAYLLSCHEWMNFCPLITPHIIRKAKIWNKTKHDKLQSWKEASTINLYQKMFLRLIISRVDYFHLISLVLKPYPFALSHGKNNITCLNYNIWLYMFKHENDIFGEQHFGDKLFGAKFFFLLNKIFLSK